MDEKTSRNGEEKKEERDPTKKRKGVAMEKDELYETSSTKAIKELQQVSGLMLPTVRLVFLGNSSQGAEKPLFTRYSVASRGMMN